MPDSTALSMETVNSNFDTDTWGFQTALAKSVGRHDLSGGLNASTTKTQRPFSQSPVPSVYSAIMQPEADSRGYIIAGFAQDKINFDLDGHNFAVIPGIAAQNAVRASISPVSILSSEGFVLSPLCVMTATSDRP